MRLGIDFDNTIVRYDALFHALALGKGLIPANCLVNKNAVRDHLRKVGREDAWTELQGEAYGPGMRGAEPFDGVKDFFRNALRQQIDVVIISHRSLHPYAGPKYDLHASARAWLEGQGFFDASDIGLTPDHAFFEVSKEAKLARIAQTRRTHYVDDLPELLSDPRFPSGVERFLFDPAGVTDSPAIATRLSGWAEATRHLLAGRA